jgi:sugar phosphate isomerase/epimerase
MPVKLAISSYSFHRFGGGPEGNDAPTIEQMIDACADHGVSGLEVLFEHLEQNGATDAERLHELRQYAAIRGITPVTIAANNNPVQTDAERRESELQKLKGVGGTPPRPFRRCSIMAVRSLRPRATRRTTASIGRSLR